MIIFVINWRLSRFSWLSFLRLSGAEDVEADEADGGGDDFKQSHNKEGIIAGEERVDKIGRIADGVTEANPFDFTIPEGPSVD